MSVYINASSLLMDIEAELRRLKQWQSTAPSAQALASTAPFCIDTLTLSQWLQFVFIPRLAAMLEQRQPLPTNCQIAPMAEEFYKDLALDSARLIEAIRQLDQLLSEG